MRWSLPLMLLSLSACGLTGPGAGQIVGPEGQVLASCTSQIPEGYALKATLATGDLVLTVQDAAGKPVPNHSFFVNGPLDGAGYRLACISGAQATTDAQGVATLKRMKVGRYRALLAERMDPQDLLVREGQSTQATLVRQDRAATSP